MKSHSMLGKWWCLSIQTKVFGLRYFVFRTPFLPIMKGRTPANLLQKKNAAQVSWKNEAQAHTQRKAPCLDKLHSLFGLLFLLKASVWLTCSQFQNL